MTTAKSLTVTLSDQAIAWLQEKATDPSQVIEGLIQRRIREEAPEDDSPEAVAARAELYDEAAYVMGKESERLYRSLS